MNIESDLTLAIQEALQSAGDNEAIREIAPVGGGDINEAARIETAESRYFVKWNAHPPAKMFEYEAHGLTLIAASKTAQVPQVIAYGTVRGKETAFLILEWIDRETTASEKAAEALGRQLGEMHRQPHPKYGLNENNYIGRLVQSNTPHQSWVEFYHTERLGTQRDLAARNGRLPAYRARLLDSLMDNLSCWINEDACSPSLLHGDLWGGNWMSATDGNPILIDPAAYCGDREIDLAMTTLFGGFPQRFYEAYNEVFPLQDAYKKREPLYQLYYLLCHLNLFGESYGGSVDSVLRRYVTS